MPQTTQWQAEQNQFDNCTKQSKKRMNIVSSDHDAKLHAQVADHEILVLYDFFHPKYLSFTG